jgi:phosphonate transport system substrate-binding protein
MFASFAAIAEQLVIGSIGDNPSDEVATFYPLAEYLAQQLNDFDIEKGKVVVVKDVQEMASLFANAQIDMYMDSPFPSLAVSQLVDTEIKLRRWKQGKAEYRSVIVAHRDSAIASLLDLKGKTIAFEEPFSTSGYFLPKSALINAGLSLKEVRDSTSHLEPTEVGYIFTGDETNTLAWILRKRVQAAAFGSHDLEALRPEERRQLKVIHETANVPRQVVSFRRNLDERLVKRICEVLKSMEGTEQGQQVLVKLEKTTRFDDLPDQTKSALSSMRVLLKEDEQLQR